MEIYSVRDILLMQTNKKELGYLAGKLELGGLDTHESAKFDFLLNECSMFYGQEKRKMLQEAITEYTVTEYKKLLKGAGTNEMQA
jgi:hypothetical protein